MKRNITKLVSTIMIVVVTLLMSSCSKISTTENHTDSFFQIPNLFAKSEYEKVYDTYADKMEKAVKEIRRECLAAEKRITDKDELTMYVTNKCSEIAFICFDGKVAMLEIDESKHSDSEYEKWSKKLEDKQIECLMDAALK